LDPTKHVFIGGNHDDYTMRLTDLKPDDPQVLAGNNNFTVVGYGPNNFAEQHVGFLTELQDDPVVYEFSHMPPNHLGNFGVWNIPGVKPIEDLSGSIFYVRGAWSIDGRWRRSVASGGWFPREQLSMAEGTRALEMYEKLKPDFVVTHQAPTSAQKFLRLLYGDGKSIQTQTGTLLDLMHNIHQPKLWVFGHYHQFAAFEHRGTHFVCLNMFPEDGWCLDFDENLRPIGTL